MPNYRDHTVLTPRERAFVHEYLVDLNATQAMIRAKYSARTASQTGTKLLAKPAVKAEVAKLQAERLQKTDMTGLEVLNELAKIARSNPANFTTRTPDGRLIVDFSRMSDNDLAAISSMEFETEVLPKHRRRVTKKAGKGSGQALAEVAAPRQVVRKIRFWDKPRALEMLARHHGILSPDPIPPPAPNDERRQMIVNVLFGSLDDMARAMHPKEAARPAMVDVTPPPLGQKPVVRR